MSNFEKFKTKQITTTESSLVMGGEDFSYCDNSSDLCMLWEFNSRATSCDQWQGGSAIWFACLDSACDDAISACTPF